MEMFNKERFKQAYQIAMAQEHPALFRQMMREKMLKKHLTETADEAEKNYQEQVRSLKEKRGMDEAQAKAVATEIVFHEMIQFPASPM